MFRIRKFRELESSVTKITVIIGSQLLYLYLLLWETPTRFAYQAPPKKWYSKVEYHSR